MKVAIDVSPLKNASQYRGIGKYTEELVKSLEELRIKNLELTMVEDGKIPNDADLVHYPYFDPFWLTLPIIKPKPAVVTIHDVTPLVFPNDYPPGIKGGFKLMIQKFSLKGAKTVITDSENSKKDIVKYLGYPLEKIEVIPLAASTDFKPINDKDFLAEVKEKYRLPDNFAVYVGDINRNKNIPRLVKACEKIGVPLMIIGKQATEKDFDRSHVENRDLVWLQNFCQQQTTSNKQQAVRLLGFVPTENLVVILNLATVYVQPSLYEGFGLPILEAMACGCPVVVSKVASLPEVAGSAAIYVDPCDIKDIALGIEEVMGDTPGGEASKKIRSKLIKAGFTQAKKFSWQNTARMTYGVYQKLVQG